MRKTKKKHGGKRIAGPGKKIGRPKSPDSRTSILHFCVSATDAELCVKANHTKWAHRLIVAEAKRILRSAAKS